MILGVQPKIEVKEISDITRGLKAIAKELNIPVIALSQLSRKVENEMKKDPNLPISESGSIEQDADLVVSYIEEYLARTEPAEGTEKHDVDKQNGESA